ncbi:MAG: flagellar basal body rod C-terminal domain-containing protein [Desulforegulaceae bacterium]|jgi:flagellar basal-body rod protein FlgC|nr:flagellar basal body rod C-terminal domain-containing protein [Desulforegulaceae bacterium]
MISSIGSSQAALRAYSTQLHANSNNIANVNSQEFKRQDAVINQDSNNQPTAQVRNDNTPGPFRQTISEDGMQKFQEMSNTDLAKEMTGMISAQNSYSANLKTIQTQSEMTGTIIDIKG